MIAGKLFVVAALVLAGSGHVNACDMKAAEAAFSSADFAEAERTLSGSTSAQCVRLQADAAFAQGKEHAAFPLYAKAWASELDAALDATKGSSKFWNTLGKGAAALMAAGSLYATSQGAMTAEQANANMLTSYEFVEALDKDFAHATGNVDLRKQVKATVKDLRALARRRSSSLLVVHPNWSTFPGVGMARVHANGHVCNAVRSRRGQYLVSPSCLQKSGVGGSDPWFISIGSMLRPSEFAKVSNITFRHGPDGSPQGLATLEVSADGTDTAIASNDWGPTLFTGSEDLGSDTARYAAVWYAPEFNHLVPIIQHCANSRFEGCGDIHAHSATLWVSPCATGCAWMFYGIAGSDGGIGSLHAANESNAGG